VGPGGLRGSLQIVGADRVGAGDACGLLAARGPRPWAFAPAAAEQVAVRGPGRARQQAAEAPAAAGASFRPQGSQRRQEARTPAAEAPRQAVACQLVAAAAGTPAAEGPTRAAHAPRGPMAAGQSPAAGHGHPRAQAAAALKMAAGARVLPSLPRLLLQRQRTRAAERPGVAACPTLRWPTRAVAGPAAAVCWHRQQQKQHHHPRRQ
jgi:hypothetical protein